MAGTHNPKNVHFSSDISSPGYIESKASSRHVTKENLRTEELMSAEVLENSAGLQLLLEAYYTYMNLEEFVYSQSETYSDIVLDNKAVFRVDDPRNENDHFFGDHDGANSVLTLTDETGYVLTYSLDASSVNITNGNNLPGSLANSKTAIGKTFTVSNILSTVEVASTGTDTNTFTLTSSNPLINEGLPITGAGIPADTIVENVDGTFIRLSRTATINSGTVLTVTFNTQTATLITPIKYWAGPGASYALNTIEESMDIDATAAQYLELIQKEIAAVVPRSIPVNKRNLYKAITEYYKIRGSSDSIEVFFRLLFDDEVEVEYPWDKTLIPSSGNWDANPSLPKGGIYLDKKGFLSDTIKIQDSLRYQKFSYLIRTGQNLSSWDYFYNRLVHPAGFKYFAEILIQLFGTRDELGDDQKIERQLRYVGGPKHNQLTGEVFTGYGRTNRFTVSSMPDLQPGVIGIEDIPLLVEMFASSFLPFTYVDIHRSGRMSLTVPNSGTGAHTVTAVEIADPGFGYTIPPVIVVNGVAETGQTISQATITCTIDSQGRINGTTITNAGSGYQTAFANVAANPNISKISNIQIVPDTTKKYSTPPGIIFDAPTSVDNLGLPLETNVTATGKYLLAPTGVDKIEMINNGSGYTSVPDVSFSQPETHFTAQPFLTEDFENATISTENYDSWREINVNDHTASIDSTEADTGSKSLKLQTSTLDTDASGNIGGLVRRLKLDAPEFTSRLPGNRIKVKVRAKKASSNGASFFKMAYSTNQHGNSGWQQKTLTTDWADYEFEYNISATTPTNEDYVGFQGDGNDGIVYIDNVSITVKWDYPRVSVEIENGRVNALKVYHKGSGYTQVPTVSISGNATAVAQLVPSEIASAEIVNPGFGYILSPKVYIASVAKNESRVKPQGVTRILELNHTDVDPHSVKVTNPVQTTASVRGRQLYNGQRLQKGVLTSGQNWNITETNPVADKIMGGYTVSAVPAGYRTQPGNDYYSQKTNILESNMLYDFNETLEVLGDTELQSTSISDINKYNVNSFVHSSNYSADLHD